MMNLLVCFSLFLCFFLDHGVSGVDPESVSVMEGDSVTLNTGVQTNQQEDIRWYYNDIRIALIRGDLSKICTDVQCKEGTERFRDRLKLDHQTGSLTIMNIRTTDSGEYTLHISSGSTVSEQIFSVSVYGVSGVDPESVSVMEGDSVTLNTGVQTNQQEDIRWYYNDIRIALINGDLSKSCTDVQCNEGPERFRDRLKLDHQTGSLTIMNIRTTDSGEYKLKIIRGSKNSDKTFSVSVHVLVPVMEEDSVTLNTAVNRILQDRISYYFNDTRIAQINGDLWKSCTDVQCNEGTERFRDRLKLDNQTGSLTIMNITNTDSGLYELKISSSSRDSEKTFNVSVHGVSAAERDKMKRKSVMEGESVTLDPGEASEPNDVMTWYYNDTLLAEITGDQSKICTDVQCEERFRDRLKLDHLNGSLTIMNSRNTDSGEYKLLINSSRFTISRSFSVSVTDVPDSGSSPGTAAAITVVVVVVVVVVLLFVAVGVIYCRRRRPREQGSRTLGDDQDTGVPLQPI